MFDFNYKNQKLKYVTVTNAAVSGDADKLAELIEKEEAEFDSNRWEWPSFGGGDSGSDFVWTYDASEWSDYEGAVTWSCRVDFASLDWERPWDCQPILDAERIYRQRQPRQQMEADAARFLQRCAVDSCGSLTPLMADRLMDVFLHEAMPCEADESEDVDQMAALLSEAMEDARPTSTGLPQLDAVLGGGLHVGVSILAGDPSAGKTSLGVQASLFTANQHDGKAVYCMCDGNGKKSAFQRMLSCAAAITGVEGCELGRFSEWDAREQYQAREAFEHVTQGHIELTDQTDVSELISWLNYLTLTAGRVGFVVVDYVQRMSYEARTLADTEAASLAVSKLREWAYAHNAVVLLLSAFTKSASENHARGAAPTMTDVLGSTELAYSAEHVLALTNHHDGSGTVTVRDLKHRHAGNAAQADRACTLRLDAEHGYFT